MYFRDAHLTHIVCAMFVIQLVDLKVATSSGEFIAESVICVFNSKATYCMMFYNILTAGALSEAIGPSREDVKIKRWGKMSNLKPGVTKHVEFGVIAFHEDQISKLNEQIQTLLENVAWLKMR